MNWTALLEENHTSNAFSINEPTLVPLLDYQLLLVSGADRETFLQGQVTCDIAALHDKHWKMGAHCTPKGRMISSFVAAPFLTQENTIALRVHKSIAEKALEALKKYAVFSKVTLTLQDELALAALLTPDEAHSSFTNIGTTTMENGVQQLTHTAHRKELWLPHDMLKTFIASENATLQSSSNLWHLAHVSDGIGEVVSDTSETFLPQEMNFQFTDGVSFKKGCYTGQEIVARLHYRGELKKHMYRGQIDAETAPQAGEMIIDEASSKACGKIVRSAQAGLHQWDFLALVDNKVMNDDHRLKTEKSPANIQWLPLPYAIS